MIVRASLSRRIKSHNAGSRNNYRIPTLHPLPWTVKLDAMIHPVCIPKEMEGLTRKQAEGPMSSNVRSELWEFKLAGVTLRKVTGSRLGRQGMEWNLSYR